VTRVTGATGCCVRRASLAIVGIDLGATKTLVAIASIASGAVTRGEHRQRSWRRSPNAGRGSSAADAGVCILAESRFPTPRSGPGAAIRAVADGIAALLAGKGLPDSSLRAIGIGVPGVCDPVKGVVVWAPNLKGWRDVRLGSALGRRFGAAVMIENDADMAVLGESWRGAGRGMRNLVTLTVGTGIGGGVIANGSLVRGAGDVAGAAGWMPIGGIRLEAIASGPAIVRRYSRLSRRGRRGACPRRKLRLRLAGFAVLRGAEAVCRLAVRGDPAARRAVREAAVALGRATASLVSVLNPEAVVFGGGVMEGAGRLMLPVIRRETLRFAQPVAARQARILLSPLGNRAGLLGALGAALSGSRSG